LKRGLAAALAVVLCGCGRVPGTASSLAQIRQQVDGQRVCAPLVSSGWPIELSAGVLAAPSLDALVAAGLFRRQALPGPPDEPARVRLVPSAAGIASLRLRHFAPAIPAQPLLCYGRAQVVAIATEMVGSAVAPDQKDTPRLSYTFRVVDAPGWARRADVRRAFPFLGRAIGPVLRSRDEAFLSGGAWRLPHPPDESTAAELVGSGFLDCPVPDLRRDSPCR
jgi:hypothetical protein